MMHSLKGRSLFIFSLSLEAMRVMKRGNVAKLILIATAREANDTGY